MQFRHIDATFGTLDRCTLTLSSGLNIIEAPNESGKSTLLAFLRAMLYGLPTRERGASADKNRYAPWSLAPMRGTLSLSCRLGELTLQRDTARASAPMGRFSAVFSGSGEPVPDLTAASCGETLLGIPAEVYERSAFLRQSSLPVDQTAELERRIASLITAGDDGASFSDANALLKKQLNARKYNKSGRIPALESELAQQERALAELSSLTAQKREAAAALAACEAEHASLSADLRAHDLCDAQERRAARLSAQDALSRAEGDCAQFRRLLRESETPPRDTLLAARAKLDAHASLQGETAAASQRAHDAHAALSDFDVHAPRSRTLLYIVLFALSLAAFVALQLAHLPASSLNYVSPILPFAAAAFFLFKALRSHAASRRRKAERAALAHAAQEADASAAAQQKLQDTAAQELLSLLALGDLARAEDILSEGLARWDTLSQLEAAALAARSRCDALPASPDDTLPAPPLPRPARSREALRAALADCDARSREAHRTIDYTDGRCRALGAEDELRAALDETREALAREQREYDALSLAMETLAQANAALQNRFSPALSRRTAELFSRLTDGKYDTVLLDRSFRAQTGETGETVSHDALFLSLGALDQLYLALRLAICETVLPQDDPIPLVLDDALVRFDDARCRAALDLLYEESRTRQLLLFTCQHREAAYLAGREGVRVLSL